MAKKTGIGIIGTGFARKVQIPAFLTCENAEIVSVASASLANAETTAQEFNIKHFTDDWHETVENKDVSLVCITTPPNLHFEQTLYAIEKEKHVLCEKPMAMSANEARQMSEKAREKGVLALIDHELRFLDGRQKAFEMLGKGAIGKIRHVKASFRAPHRGDVNLPWNWWSDKSQGGGALGAIGSHIIDSFNWLLRTKFSQVFCQLQTQIKRRKTVSGEWREVTTDDEANLLVRFDDNDLCEDTTGNISISMVEYPNYRHRMEFFGTEGAMQIDYLGKILLAKAGETDWTTINTVTSKFPTNIFDSGFPSGFLAFAPKIIEAIQNGKTEIEHAATFDDGLEVQKVIDAAHESNEKGIAIKVSMK